MAFTRVCTLDSLTHYSLSAFEYVPEARWFIAACEVRTIKDISTLQWVGKLWNIIDPQTYGAYIAGSFEKDSILLIDTNLTDDKISCCCWVPPSKTAIFGFASGRVGICKANLKLTQNAAGLYDRERYVLAAMDLTRPHVGSIVEVKEWDGNVVSISNDNYLKISAISDGDFETLGGGSLRQRLGDAYLTSIEIDKARSQIFLGTSLNRIFVYDVREFKPSYSYSITTKNFGPVASLKTDTEYSLYRFIFASDGCEVLVWPYEASPRLSAVFSLMTTDCDGEAGLIVRIEYWKEESKLLVGYKVMLSQSGIVAVWDTRLGTLLTVLRTNAAELRHMQLVPSQRLLLTSSAGGEIAVWRLCL